MNERAIKDLSIALEALSRISGSDSEAFSLRIHSLLDDLLKEQETATKLKYRDDEIPF